MRTLKLIVTEDGSHSLYVPELKETFHSFHGALQESGYVYLEKGLNEWVEENKKPASILEAGFGTGLNILLTIAEALKNKLKIKITTLEPFPLSPEIIEQLNYHHFIREKYGEQFAVDQFFKLIHECPWNQPLFLTEDVEFEKRNEKLQDYTTAGLFDIVFFDAFAPSKQPDLWEKEVFSKIFNLMNHGGILVTYCAQGQFKRNLKEAGFMVETLPGPPGKKEMVRGRKG